MTKEELLQFREIFPKHMHQIMKKRFQSDFEKIENYCKNNNLIHLPDFSAKLYHYCFDIPHPIKCICGNIITTYNTNRIWGPRKFCSRQCQSKDEQFLKSRASKNSYKQKEVYFTKSNKILKDDKIKILSFQETCNRLIKTLQIIEYENIFKSIVNTDPILYKSINFFYPIKDYEKSSEIIYLLKNGLKNPPKCNICNTKKAIFINYNKGYMNRCNSIECKKLNTNRQKSATKHNIINKLKSDIENPKSKEEVKNLITNKHSLLSERSQFQSLIKSDFDLVHHIFYYTKYLNANCKFTERLYHIINDLNEIQKCNTCNTKLNFWSINVGYSGCGKCFSCECSHHLKVPPKGSGLLGLFQPKSPFRDLSKLSFPFELARL